MSEDMKICRQCASELPLTEFYKHPQMMDGHLNVCKQCVKSRVRKYRRDNGDAVRAYDRKRYARGDRREERAAYGKKYLRQRRPSRNAHVKVRRAIQAGLLTKEPCLFSCAQPNDFQRLGIVAVVPVADHSIGARVQEAFDKLTAAVIDIAWAGI